MRRLAVPFLLLALAGCQHEAGRSTARSPAPPPPLDPWVLTTLDGADAEPAYLSNGLIGVRVGRGAGGLGPDGKPLGFSMIDEYEPTGEERIRTMPNPLLVTWALGNEPYRQGADLTKTGGTPLDPRGGTDYRQSLDMRTGVLTTSWSQAGAAIRCDTVLHPTERALGQRWTIRAAKDTTYAVRTLDYGGPNDPQEAVAGDQEQGIAITASPRRVVTYGWHAEGGTGNALVAERGFRGQDGSLRAGQTLVFERTLSFGKAAAKPLPLEPTQAASAVLERATPRPWGYGQIQADAAVAWKKRWQSDIVIDGPVEDQQAVHSFLYYLRASIAPGARRAIAPMALSSDVYNGHVFWDADIWVFPALALTDPDLARAIPDYRLDRAAQARRNFDEWIAAGRPTASGRRPFVVLSETKPVPTPKGVKYPWESSVTGKETAIGPSRFEDHITGSVAWGLGQAGSLGLATPNLVDAVLHDANLFYFYRKDLSKRGFSIRGTMSPDENHTGDNDLYTNLLAQWLLHGSLFGKPWHNEGYVIPHDDKTLLTYDGDPVTSYKQAAAILACYPLQYPPAEAQTRAMLERFGPKTIANGPAMTDAIEGLLWARAGDPAKGYDEWRKGWVDFTRHPLMMFSEKRRSARTYFATGAGGALQTVLYGFAGLRIDDRKAPGAVWSHPLLGGKVLSVRPSLPPAWKAIHLKGIALPDGRYDMDIAKGTVTAKRV